MVKSNSEYRSIRKKLMVAIAMVLVASIMMVSASYAWFTLSTAPEVTGITTSIGSNGNLEMACVPVPWRKSPPAVAAQHSLLPIPLGATWLI